MKRCAERRSLLRLGGCDGRWTGYWIRVVEYRLDFFVWEWYGGCVVTEERMMIIPLDLKVPSMK